MSKKLINETIHAKGLDIAIYTEDFQNEFISLTDLAKYKSDEPNDFIKNWLRNRDTIEFFRGMCDMEIIFLVDIVIPT